jgi:hypothetical protein
VRRFFEVLSLFEQKDPQDEEEKPLDIEEMCLFQVESPQNEFEVCHFEARHASFPLEFVEFELP